MESQPQNPEFWINPENFHLCLPEIASKKIFLLTLCMLFFCVFFLSSADIFQNQFFEKLFQNTSDKSLYQHFVGPDLGPNCLQRLSADKN